MLRFENVKKYYGSLLAIEIPELLLDKGIWWLQGENGSGKTTLLKMIAGMHPFTGNIILEGELSITKQRQRFLKLVNYAEAEPLYPDFLTAKDIVELYCKTKGGHLLHAQELLKQLHVYDAYTQKLGGYSSGMLKKLSLVLAFIGKPNVILLDEPLITLDANSVSTICQIINRCYQSGISFIIASHQPVQTDQLSFTGTLVAENRIVKIKE